MRNDGKPSWPLTPGFAHRCQHREPPLGWQHHRCPGCRCGPAHRCGQGPVPSSGPCWSWSEVPQHYRCLQDHRPRGRVPGTVERCVPDVSPSLSSSSTFPGLTQALPVVGTSPNVARNAIVNCAELVTYDLIKDALLKASLMTGELGWKVQGSGWGLVA